jgi:hypothetical protein
MRGYICIRNDGLILFGERLYFIYFGDIRYEYVKKVYSSSSNHAGNLLIEVQFGLNLSDKKAWSRDSAIKLSERNTLAYNRLLGLK